MAACFSGVIKAILLFPAMAVVARASVIPNMNSGRSGHETIPQRSHRVIDSERARAPPLESGPPQPQPQPPEPERDFVQQDAKC